MMSKNAKSKILAAFPHKALLLEESNEVYIDNEYKQQQWLLLVEYWFGQYLKIIIELLFHTLFFMDSTFIKFFLQAF